MGTPHVRDQTDVAHWGQAGAEALEARSATDLRARIRLRASRANNPA
jgi:hypothetical protein